MPTPNPSSSAQAFMIHLGTMPTHFQALLATWKFGDFQDLNPVLVSITTTLECWLSSLEAMDRREVKDLLVDACRHSCCVPDSETLATIELNKDADNEVVFQTLRIRLNTEEFTGLFLTWLITYTAHIEWNQRRKAKLSPRFLFNFMNRKPSLAPPSTTQ